MAARPIASIEGLEAVITNMHRYKNQTASGVERGIRKACTRLLNESNEHVPVETGILKASGYIRITGKGFNAQGAVGYSAPYAAAVHEKVGMVLKGKPRPSGIGVYWDPRPKAHAKFLENAYKQLQPEMLRIIQAEAKIRPLSTLGGIRDRVFMLISSTMITISTAFSALGRIAASGDEYNNRDRDL